MSSPPEASRAMAYPHDPRPGDPRSPSGGAAPTIVPAPAGERATPAGWARPSLATLLPIPALLALLLVAHLGGDRSASYDPAWLIVAGDTLGITVVGLVVAFIAQRRFRASGRQQLLLLGSGVLVFGAGGVLAALARGLEGGANLNVTIYDTGAVAGGAFHLVAAMLLVAGVSREVSARRREAWLLAGYGGVILFLISVAGASIAGVLPPFFVQGVGPSALRQQVLGAADLLFLFSFIVFFGSYLRTREAFLFWYAGALALTCISLTAFFVQPSVGSPVGWVGRVSQYVGGAYFLLSLVSAARSARTRRTSLDDVIARSLSGAEERFRALAENSPDAIDHEHAREALQGLKDQLERRVAERTADLDRAMGALDAERRRFRDVLEMVPAYIVLITQDHHVRLANRFFEERFGRANGRRCYEYLFGLTAPCENCESFKPFTTRAPHDWEWRGPDGRDYEIHDFPFTDVDGSQLVMEMGLDITDRKRSEAALRDLNETLEQRVAERTAELRDANDRLEQTDRRKNEFLAVLSHELRNPLAPITNSLYILDHAPPGARQAVAARQVIGRQVKHLSSLVNDLLDVTRIARAKVQLQKERLDLNEVVRRVVEDHRCLFDGARLRLELSPAAGPVPVSADATRIVQVVGNLLQNSVKFAAAGGCTRVSVAVEDGRATVRVADDGAGMDAATLGRLFEPFMQAEQTLDRTKGGLGLGLALVKGLVELHGGSVSAHSEGIGKGAEFVARLPLDDGGERLERAASARPPRPRRRILVIEDNVDAADTLGEALGLEGHEVAVAYDGHGGLAKARTLRPEVVLCDIGLPGMDGFEVARVIRADEKLRGAHLVALSGYALPDDLRRASEAGFERHLAKPPSMEQLAALLAGLPSVSDDAGLARDAGRSSQSLDGHTKAPSSS